MTHESLPRRLLSVAAGIGFGLLFYGAAGFLRAEPVEPAPGIQLEIWPPEIELRGSESAQQLVVTARYPDGSAHDVTLDAVYTTAQAEQVAVQKGGRLQALKDGAATVVVEALGARAERVVAIKEAATIRDVHFENEVIPILTKYSCNSGGCHGKAEGQNGFKLSLLGFDAAFDFDAIVAESRGRRIFRSQPEHSLFLTKPAGQMPHGGGLKIKPESDDYRKLVRWIRTGTPAGDDKAARVARIEVHPAATVLSKGAKQRLAVAAVFTDGHREDATRLAQYESNDKELVEVNEDGIVTAGELNGECAVMVRYQGQVTTFRATLPLRAEIGPWPAFAHQNFVDAAVEAKLKLLNMPPSDLSSDGEFLRRAWVDVCGTLPPADEAQKFLADADPEKRRKLIDRLLDRPEYASYFALKWSDILRNRRQGQAGRMHGTFGLHRWLREGLEANKPYDQLVREVLTATGDLRHNPPVAWYREVTSPTVRADDVAQVFLGTRIQCAQCHHHPFEKWSQNDYYGMVGFFSRIGQKTPPGAGAEPVVFTRRDGEARHPRTNEVVPPKPLDGPAMPPKPGDDPRLGLAKWMTAKGNPFFARALVNRMWAHFFGRGIVEPIDDLRATNPPSNPELLDALAKDFEENGFDLKRLVRTITTSRTYGLSAIPNQWNQKDRNAFSHYPTKRLQAEVLLDAIHTVTLAPHSFGGLPAGTRAIELPDESFGSTFLELFGKPKRVSSCECERVGEASLGQSLHLINSTEIAARINAKGGRVELLAAADQRADSDKIRELYLVTFTREPTSEETATSLAYINALGRERKSAYEDLVWALLNTKEFQFQH